MTTNNPNNPQFTHDCDDCIFLGNFNGKDLYVHVKDPQTIIARNGNEPEEYKSGLGLCSIDPELKEAGVRAVKLDLLSQEMLDKHDFMKGS